MRLLKVLAVALAVWVVTILVVLSLTENASGEGPEASPYLTACAMATLLGQRDGLLVRNCRLVKQSVIGNTATITVRIDVPGQGVFDLTMSLLRSEWGLTPGLTVQPR